MNLKSQDGVTTATLFIGATFSLRCRCFGNPFDIITLGNFSVNNWVTQKMCLKWSMQFKYSCLFKHDDGATALQCISHHDVLKFAKKLPGVLFLALWRSSHKRASEWSNNLFLIFAFSLCTFVASALHKNVRNITANRVKDCCGRRVKGTRQEQNTGYGEQTKHRLHSVAPFASSYQLGLTFTSEYGKRLQMETES